MRSEADVRGVVARALRANGVLVQPIESPLTGLGIPDLFVRTSKVSAWVEFKFERAEPRMPWKTTFRDGQYGWLRRHYELGGVSVLGVWTPSGLHCYKDSDIREVYDTLQGGFNMTNISGASLISWLNQ